MASISISHTETWDESKPAGTRAKSLGDDDIREFKRSERERQAIDHIREASETSDAIGCHKKITFAEVQSSDPTSYDNVGYLYLKDVSDVVELFWEDESGNVKQLTSGGVLNIAATEAVLLTGNQTIAGVKTFSSFPVTPSSDPSADYEVANKKYVDDRVGVDDTTIERSGGNLQVKDAGIGATQLSSALGTWTSRTNDTAYEATADGFACGFVSQGGGNETIAYSDASNPPTTIRMHNSSQGDGNDMSGVCIPVKKGNYYKITGVDGTATVYWIPLGS